MVACVSDDFEMICKAYVIGFNDKWLNALILSYANQEFPCGALKLEDYNLDRGIKQVLREFSEKYKKKEIK